jgi:hypothetical protein
MAASTDGTDEPMPARGSEPFTIPDPFWELPEVTDVLRKRDVGRLLALVYQRTRATQTQIGVACETTQPKINEVISAK